MVKKVKILDRFTSRMVTRRVLRLGRTQNLNYIQVRSAINSHVMIRPHPQTEALAVLSRPPRILQRRQSVLNVPSNSILGSNEQPSRNQVARRRMSMPALVNVPSTLPIVNGGHNGTVVNNGNASQIESKQDGIQNVRDNASVGKASTTDDNIGQVEDMLVDTSTEAAPNAAESHEIQNMSENASDVSMADATISQGENMLIDTSTETVPNTSEPHEIQNVRNSVSHETADASSDISMTDANIGPVEDSEDMLVDTSTEAVPNTADEHEIQIVGDNKLNDEETIGSVPGMIGITTDENTEANENTNGENIPEEGNNDDKTNESIVHNKENEQNIANHAQLPVEPGQFAPLNPNINDDNDLPSVADILTQPIVPFKIRGRRPSDSLKTIMPTVLEEE